MTTTSYGSWNRWHPGNLTLEAEVEAALDNWPGSNLGARVGRC